jgi:DNA polymerase III subunit beta
MMMQTTGAHLRAATRMLSGIVDTRPTVPILSTIRIEGDEVTATDLDIEVVAKMPVTGRSTLKAAIDWRALTRLSALLGADEDVSVDEVDGLARLSFNGAEYRIPSAPALAFPSFGPVEGPQTRIGNVGLAGMMGRVLFAVSTEMTRYYLNGVAIVARDGEAPMLCATDGHRMAALPLPFVIDGGIGAIIPHRLARWIAARGVEPERITFADGMPRLRLDYPGGLRVSAKLIDGTFPDVFRVIPTNAEPLLSVDRRSVLRVLRRIIAIDSSRARYTPVKIEAGDGGIVLSSKSADFSAREHVPAEVHRSGPWSIGVNPFYLRDAVSRLSGDRLNLAAVPGSEGGSPAVLTSDDDPMMILQMPMRV